jgi:hypothetical protein
VSNTRDSGNTSMQALTAWADAVGVSRRTAVHWATTGALPAFRIGRRWFVDAVALTGVVLRQRPPAPPASHGD